MRPTPWNDFADFMTKAAWFTWVFWALLAASAVIAALAWRRDPEQRRVGTVAGWLLRVLVGGMWWQQTLWKIPPNYDGLKYWMQQQVAHASTALQSAFVSDIVLPNLFLFAPLVYAIEVTIGVSLLLGLLSRAGALLGLAMALNLWLGLYSAPGEWPWTYMFLIIIEAQYVIDPPGRRLGADTLWHRAPAQDGWLATVVA